MTGHTIPLAEPDLHGREAEYLARCVADNWVSSAGPFVTDLERRFQSMIGCRAAVATASGTAALNLALRGMGIGRGDFVAVPDWTFAATANAVIHAEAEPWLVDVTADSWTLDAELLRGALEEARGKIKAVIAVHALGHPADMDAIMTVAHDAGVVVIEDAAGAIGARYKGRPAGALSDAAVFSFNGNKTVTAGGGGMIVTDDEALASRVRHLSTQARTGARYRYDEAGFNYRMTNLCAAVGLAQAERADEMVAAKQRIAARYDAALARREDLQVMPRCEWADSGCWLYSVLTATANDADNLTDHLNSQQIEARIFWERLSEQVPYRSYPKRLGGTSARLSGCVVSLPCSSHLSEDDQARVIAAVDRWRGAALERAA